MQTHPTTMDGTERISRHFRARELWCRHCHRLHLNSLLLPALEALRKELGTAAGFDVSIIVNSGYRCRTHNASVKGSPTSKHLTGEAADVRAGQGVGLLAIYEAALRVPIFEQGGIGVYPEQGFVHLDIHSRRRWGWLGGKMTTIDAALKRLHK